MCVRILAVCLGLVACGFLVPVHPALAQAPPCAAGTPQGVRFDGLRSNVPYGPPEIFSVAERFDDWALDGGVTVRMADSTSGKPFFERRIAVDEELYVQLDLDDPPVLITATYVQRSAVVEDDGSAPQGSTVCTHTR